MRHVIGFAKRHTVMAKDVIGGHQVKIERWNRPIDPIFVGSHVENSAFGKRYRDSTLAAVDEFAIC